MSTVRLGPRRPRRYETRLAMMLRCRPVMVYGVTAVRTLTVGQGGVVVPDGADEDAGAAAGQRRPGGSPRPPAPPRPAPASAAAAGPSPRPRAARRRRSRRRTRRPGPAARRRPARPAGPRPSGRRAAGRRRRAHHTAVARTPRGRVPAAAGTTGPRSRWGLPVAVTGPGRLQPSHPILGSKNASSWPRGGRLPAVPDSASRCGREASSILCTGSKALLILRPAGGVGAGRSGCPGPAAGPPGGGPPGPRAASARGGRHRAERPREVGAVDGFRVAQAGGVAQEVGAVVGAALRREGQ